MFLAESLSDNGGRACDDDGDDEEEEDSSLVKAVMIIVISRGREESRVITAKDSVNPLLRIIRIARVKLSSNNYLAKDNLFTNTFTKIIPRHQYERWQV